MLYNEESNHPHAKQDDISKKWGTHWHLTLRDPTDEYIQSIQKSLKTLHDQGYLDYYAGGEEFIKEKRHIHIAVGTHYATRKTTLTHKLRLFKGGVKQGWSSYYLNSIYKESTPQANYLYCTKGKILFATNTTPVKDSQNARAGVRDRNAECIRLAKLQDWEKLETLYPGMILKIYEKKEKIYNGGIGHWIRNGARLKGLYMRQDPPKDQGLDHNRHLWIYGPSGKGKTSIVEYLYPGHYKKRSDPDWLGWDSNYAPHKVILINDLDLQGMSRLGIDHLKELCDPQGFNANKKYAGGDVINPSLVIITSNFAMGDCLQPDMPGRHEHLIALRRRFRMVDADTFIRENGLMLCSKEEIEFAKRVGLWDDFKYKCLFKPIQYKDEKDYNWLKTELVNTPTNDS